MLSFAPLREYFETLNLMLGIVQDLNLDRGIWQKLHQINFTENATFRNITAFAIPAIWQMAHWFNFAYPIPDVCFICKDLRKIPLKLLFHRVLCVSVVRFSVICA